MLMQALSACGEYGDLENVVVSKELKTPERFTPTLAVTVDATVFESNGGSLTFTVNSNTAWTVEAPAWCTCDPAVGNGNGVVTLNAAENAETTVRTGQVTVRADGVEPQIFTITQKGRNDVPSAGDNPPPA